MMYFFTALLAAFTRRSAHRRFWWIVTAIVISIGLIRMTGLISEITQYGRVFAYDDGWYDHRRPLQALGLLVVMAIGTILVGAVTFRFRRSIPEAVGVLATSASLGLLVVRSVSLHQIDRLLGLRVWNTQLGWLLDVVLLISIAVAAHWKTRTSLVDSTATASPVIR